jgi:hypothetical protein
MCASFHLNMGTPSGSDLMKPIVKLPMNTSTYLLLHSILLWLSLHKGFEYHPQCPENVTLHIPHKKKSKGNDIREAWGPRDWSTMANPSAIKCFIIKCLHIITPVWWHNITLKHDEWLQFFQMWDHVQLEHVKADIPYDDLLRKEKCVLSLHCA